MQDHTKLTVWQRARSLTVAVHEAARRIRAQASPGLRSQLIRATMSIGATIAEGAGRDTRIDFARFVSRAISSTSEVEHHLTVCADLGLIDATINERLVVRSVEIRRMLFGLRRALLDADQREQQQPRPRRIPTRDCSTDDSKLKTGLPEPCPAGIGFEFQY